MNIDDWFDKEMFRLDEMLKNGEISDEQYRANEKKLRAEYRDDLAFFNEQCDGNACMADRWIPSIDGAVWVCCRCPKAWRR